MSLSSVPEVPAVESSSLAGCSYVSVHQAALGSRGQSPVKLVPYIRSEKALQAQC